MREPYLKNYCIIGLGKVVEVKRRIGQVYDAQGESYYRNNGSNQVQACCGV